VAYTPITEGATNWDDPVNAAFTDHDTRITAAQATADLALSTAGTAPARPLFGALDSSSSKVIWGGTAATAMPTPVMVVESTSTTPATR